MAETSLEKRLARAEAHMTALDAKIAQLEQERAAAPPSGKPWWEEIRGTFKNDPAYDEAMRLGSEWRKAQQEEYAEDTDA